RIDLPGASQGGQVAAVFFQRLKFALGVLVRDALVAAEFSEGFEHVVESNAVGLKHLFQRRIRLADQTQQQVLGADIFVLQFGGLGLGGVQRALERWAEKSVARTGSLDLHALLQSVFEI